jgi:hypothetical protein
VGYRLHLAKGWLALPKSASYKDAHMVVKRNHFVPQVYLRGFCNSERRLWVYDSLQGKVWESDPGSVAYEKNLYAVELPDGSVDCETLEKTFGSVETRFPVFRDKVNSFSTISGEHSYTFITFLALTRLRNPQFAKGIKANERFNEAVWQNRIWSDPVIIEKAWKKANETLGLNYSYEEFLTRAKFDVRGLLPKTEKECLFIALYGLEKLIEELCVRLSWSFLNTGPEEPFVTSDNPFIWVDPLSPIVDFELGLNVPSQWIEIIMPISPTITAIGTRGGPKTYFGLPDGVCEQLNLLTIRNACRFVYASFRSERLLEQVTRSGNGPESARPSFG